jgi:hypothetical protein
MVRDLQDHRAFGTEVAPNEREGGFDQDVGPDQDPVPVDEERRLGGGRLALGRNPGGAA